MIPEEVFKRRHFGTPPLFSLIITNSILVCFITPFFATCGTIHWLFWVFLASLAIYNFFTIRRNWEEFTKIITIAYAISMVVEIAGIILLLHKSCSASL
ncbi:hypothetical protein [Mucilaginibacter jinjuensis]|uniref:Uncharacterized protein n=1 Tax=Mucilaginibacter jinjuensis TaxID=1176721 RepID=A0ABY7T999_9SPHI|nr:hypothetical protein [Mucilaginibacter jinjuensis]WCT12808.1 hypothetical protein PQO05_02525 [Mucilaginibacter jinjuensis]